MVFPFPTGQTRMVLCHTQLVHLKLAAGSPHSLCQGGWRNGVATTMWSQKTIRVKREDYVSGLAQDCAFPQCRIPSFPQKWPSFQVGKLLGDARK